MDVVSVARWKVVCPELQPVYYLYQRKKNLLFHVQNSLFVLGLYILNGLESNLNNKGTSLSVCLSVLPGPSACLTGVKRFDI